MKAILFLMLLLLLAQASAMDPPVMEWEMQYFPGSSSIFADIHQNSNDGLIAAGHVGSSFHACLVNTDQSGNVLWTFGNDDWYYLGASRVLELPDGCFITTGTFRELSNTSYGLFISKTDSIGAGIWTKVYNFHGTTEAGYGITPLPGGGFAVTGVTYTTGDAQAWILRTDSAGDTLWTDFWGSISADCAKQVLYKDGKLVILANGNSEGMQYGSHLLFYDLNGNCLNGTEYPELGSKMASDICHASDGGFTFITEGGSTSPIIAHTDGEGNLEWYYEVAAKSEGPVDDFTLLGYSISPTMDGGYIFAGVWDFYYPPQMESSIPHGSSTLTSFSYEADETWGWLVKFDSEGNRLWEIKLDPGGYDKIGFCSARQLSEGGYITAGYYNDVGGTGINGYIIRYAPETGIDEWEESTGETLTLRSWPNPSRGPVQISLAGPEGLYSLTVHDLSGRLVREYPEVPLGGGAALVWDGLSGSGAPLPAGVYVVDLQTVNESVSTLLMRL